MSACCHCEVKLSLSKVVCLFHMRWISGLLKEVERWVVCFESVVQRVYSNVILEVEYLVFIV